MRCLCLDSFARFLRAATSPNQQDRAVVVQVPDQGPASSSQNRERLDAKNKIKREKKKRRNDSKRRMSHVNKGPLQTAETYRTSISHLSNPHARSSAHRASVAFCPPSPQMASQQASPSAQRRGVPCCLIRKQGATARRGQAARQPVTFPHHRRECFDRFEHLRTFQN